MGKETKLEVFSRNIRALRAMRGWTLEYVAGRVGVSTKQIWKYERGIDQAGYDVLSRLADLFGVSVDELLGRGLPAGADRGRRTSSGVP